MNFTIIKIWYDQLALGLGSMVDDVRKLPIWVNTALLASFLIMFFLSPFMLLVALVLLIGLEAYLVSTDTDGYESSKLNEDKEHIIPDVDGEKTKDKDKND